MPKRAKFWINWAELGVPSDHQQSGVRRRHSIPDYNGFKTDTLTSIIEIGAGLQANFGLGPIAEAFLRAGFEGQYWMEDETHRGLFGGVLTLGANF